MVDGSYFMVYTVFITQEEVDTMTEKEKQILTNIEKAIPTMSEAEKDRLLVCGELIGLICETRHDGTGRHQQKGA